MKASLKSGEICQISASNDCPNDCLNDYLWHEFLRDALIFHRWLQTIPAAS